MTISDGTFRTYQRTAETTAFYPGRGDFMGLAYATLGINGEAGEIAEQVKKTWRDDGLITPERREAIIDELGDCLWYLAMTCTELGIEFSHVASNNANKLADRRDRGVLSGSGDQR